MTGRRTTRHLHKAGAPLRAQTQTAVKQSRRLQQHLQQLQQTMKSQQMLTPSMKLRLT